MKGVSQKVADQTKGGYLDDVDLEVTDCVYIRDSFEVTEPDGSKKKVTQTAASLDVLVEGRDEPQNKKYSLGDILRPSEDGETESDEGQFLVVVEGKTSKGISQNSAWGKFQAALAVKCNFPDSQWEQGPRKALVGLRGHTTSVPGGKFDGKQGGDIPVFASIEKDSIPTVKAGSKTAAKPAAGKKAAAPVEDEPEESVEDRVKVFVAKKAAKGETTKAQLSTLMNTKFEDKDEKREAVAWVISDKNLKAGAKDGLWSFENGKVGPLEEEDAAEEDTD